MNSKNTFKDGFGIMSSLVSNSLLNFKKSIFTVVATIDFDDFSCLKYFIKAFSNLYTVNTKGRNSATSYIRCIFLYLAMFRCLDSNFTKKLCEMNVATRLPAFVIPIIENISLFTRSLNSKNVNTYGSIQNKKPFTLYDKLNGLKDNKFQGFFETIAFQTPFNSSFNTEFTRDQWFEQLCLTIDELLTKVSNEENILRRDVLVWLLIMESSDLILSPENTHRLPMVNYTLKTSQTSHIGIYRFANILTFGSSNNEYQVQVKSLEGISPNTITLLITFLFIYRPSFNCPSVIMNGFQDFSFDNIDSQHAWETYLNARSNSGNKKSNDAVNDKQIKPKDKNKKRDTNTKNNNLNPEAMPEGKIDNVVSIVNNDGYYHDAVYFSNKLVVKIDISKLLNNVGRYTDDQFIIQLC